MYPDAPQHQPAGPASLPPVTLQPEAIPSVPAPLPPVTNANDTNTSAMQIVIQTKQLTKQYAQDPFQLSSAVEQLKSRYLAEQYHIITKPVEN